MISGYEPNDKRQLLHSSHATSLKRYHGVHSEVVEEYNGGISFFSDKSWFCLGRSGGLRMVWRPCGQRYQQSFTKEHHIIPTSGIWCVVALCIVDEPV